MKCDHTLHLSDICDYVKDKIAITALNRNNYVSTENMLANKAGIVRASSLPAVAQTQAFLSGDVLVSNIRPYFKKIWFAKFDGGCSNDVLVFRAKEDVSSRFLYYVLANDTFFAYSTATSKGTKMPRGDKTAIMEYEVPRITPEGQEKITAILSVLDDKIELNNKINANLEQQAQVLFKAWFVDFEPFGGKIPEDWQEIPLEELCEVVTKGTTPTTLGKPFTEQGVNFIKGESIQENHTFDLQKVSHISDETNQLLRRSIIHSDDILFTIAGTLGRFAMVDEDLLPANTNQAVCIIRSSFERVTPIFLYSFFIGNWHNEFYAKRIQQAVQQNLSLGTIKSLPILIPTSKEMRIYCDLLSPVLKQVKQNEIENRRLSMLRNVLLPRLMSGQIEL